MKTIFEEYGKLIITIIVVVALLFCVLGSTSLLKKMGNKMDIQTDLSHANREAALEQVSVRVKPTISITNTNSLRLYADESFKPLTTISCTDTDGNELTPTITSIVYMDNIGGKQTEVIEFYDSETDVLDIPSVIGQTGTIAVFYKATDGYGVTTSKTISYIIDSERPQ